MPADAAQADPATKIGDLRIDLGAHEVRQAGALVELSALDFDLLAALAASPGRVLSRVQLLEKVWGYDFYGDERVVDVPIRTMRKALGDLAPYWGRGHAEGFFDRVTRCASAGISSRSSRPSAASTTARGATERTRQSPSTPSTSAPTRTPSSRSRCWSGAPRCAPSRPWCRAAAWRCAARHHRPLH